MYPPPHRSQQHEEHVLFFFFMSCLRPSAAADDVSVKERHEEQSEDRSSAEATGLLDGGRLLPTEAGGEGTSPSVPGVSSERVTTMLAIGAGSGFLAGAFGVGGGVLTVPSVSLATDLGHKKVKGFENWSRGCDVLCRLRDNFSGTRRGTVAHEWAPLPQFPYFS